MSNARAPRPRGGGPGGGIGMPVEKSLDFRANVTRLLGRLGPEKYLIAMIMVMTVVSVGLNVVGPKILGHATDIIFDGATGTGIDFPALRTALLIVTGLYLGSFVIALIQGFILNGVVQRAMRRLRADVEAKLHRVPLSYFDKHTRGELLSRVTNDIDNLQQSLQQSISQLLTSLLMVIGTVVMMFTVTWELALIATLTVPLAVVITGVIAKRSQREFIAQWRTTGELNGQIEETYTGHAIVRAFGRVDETNAAFRKKNAELYASSFRAQFISGTIMPGMMFVGNLVYVVLAVVGGIRIGSGAMSLGDVQAIIQYSRQLGQPISQLASMVNLLQSGVASAERVFEVLDAEEMSAEPATRPVARAEGRVAFEHVDFDYDPASPLIRDLSLIAEPGHTIAIVGPTGAGKTTLVNLIMRFYEVNAGRITVDDVATQTQSRQALREQTGMVLQDTWLFNGTIRDNIAYGNLEATDEQIIEAAKATYVDRFVRSLPDGYDTVVDDDGTAISAGEKQLLTIARAFLAQPSLLILDEATSSVDTRTEVLVQRAMAALRSDRTSFVIAHRLSTIRDADLILVMNSGRIVEQGSHEELLRHDGAYAELYNSQFAQSDEE